jgi:hypothetical protein
MGQRLTAQDKISIDGIFQYKMGRSYPSAGVELIQSPLAIGLDNRIVVVAHADSWFQLINIHGGYSEDERYVVTDGIIVAGKSNRFDGNTRIALIETTSYHTVGRHKSYEQYPINLSAIERNLIHRLVSLDGDIY